MNQELDGFGSRNKSSSRKSQGWVFFTDIRIIYLISVYEVQFLVYMSYTCMYIKLLVFSRNELKVI